MSRLSSDMDRQLWCRWLNELVITPSIEWNIATGPLVLRFLTSANRPWAVLHLFGHCIRKRKHNTSKVKDKLCQQPPC